MEIQIAPIRQTVAAERVEDIRREVRSGLNELDLASRLQPGAQVAIALPSRGITCLPEVVAPLVEALLAGGFRPFFVPAMGSHGASTAEGQRRVLEGLGFTEERFGVPIRASMETVQVGVTPDGIPVYTGADAAQAGGIILVNRIKEHTAFKAPWESGLMKILAVGLGKARGAAEIHAHGLPEAMLAAARLLLAKLPVIAGIGIVENGRHEPARIAVLPAEQIESAEPALLETARSLLPRIPLEPLDLLALEQIGKDISGTGMDLNVVGMWRRSGGPVSPHFHAIGALDLTDQSHGNAIGVGHADLITRRLANKIDLQATYKNCLTSRNYNGAKIPITLETDQELFAAALEGIAPAQARVVIARSTLDLETLWVSEALLPEVQAHPNLALAGPLQPLAFGPGGDLRLHAAPFAHLVEDG